MGNPRGEQEERAAIREISNLSPNAKEHIGHHIRNALQSLLLVCDCDITDEQRESLVESCFKHITEDLRKIGC